MGTNNDMPKLPMSIFKTQADFRPNERTVRGAISLSENVDGVLINPTTNHVQLDAVLGAAVTTFFE
jgi:hypothetical protein